MHLPSLQWLNTTLRCPGCRVTLSVDPRPRASGMFRRVGPTPQLWTFCGVVSRVLAAAVALAVARREHFTRTVGVSHIHYRTAFRPDTA